MPGSIRPALAVILPNPRIAAIPRGLAQRDVAVAEAPGLLPVEGAILLVVYYGKKREAIIRGVRFPGVHAVTFTLAEALPW